MSNRNIFKSPMANSHIPHSNRGFTLVEMLIIAPIVILVIGIFVSAIITMTGDVLAVRGKNALAFNIQDALNRIDQDVKSSGGYLATNNITLTSPQGYDDNTAVFKNADATNGTMLILNTYATTANPLSSTRNFVYTTSPNACNSALVSQNQKVAMNVVYFIKNNALWRRVIAPSNYATVGCSVPWQQPTCTPGYVASFCKTQDMKLVDGVSVSGFALNYYTSAAATTPIANAVNNTLSNTDRQTALQTASSINVTITATKTLAGRDVSQSGTIRSISPNTSSSANSIVLSGSGGGNWAYKRPITITNSSGGALTNYQVQINPFTDATFINNTGLVGSWHLNEGSGAAVSDMSGSNNNGTISGTNYWNASGKFGSTFSGNGTNLNVVNIPNSTSLSPTTAITIETWVKLNTSGVKEIIGKNNASSNTIAAYELYQANQKFSFKLFKAGALTQWTTNTDVSLGTWHHVLATWDGSFAKIYVDGVLDMTPASYTGSIDTTTGPLTIGAYGDGQYPINGNVDEVKIYNRALSAVEIAFRYGTSGVPKVRSDHADIRFANISGATEYSYWQETDGKYWVKIPSLAAGDTTINMYYGNPSATKVSNGDNTFIFFDDFESGNLNKWNAKSGTPLIGSTYAYSGGYGGQASSTTCNENSLQHTFSATAMPTVIAEYRRRIVNGYSYAGIAGPLGTDARYIGADISSPTNYTIYDSAYNPATSTSVASWRKYKVSASPTATTYYTDGVQIPFTTNRAGTFKTIILYACSAGGYSNFDDVIVRQYASTEPTHAAPGAESAP